MKLPLTSCVVLSAIYKIFIVVITALVHTLQSSGWIQEALRRSLYDHEVDNFFKDLFSSQLYRYLYQNKIERLNKQSFIGLTSLEFLYVYILYICESNKPTNKYETSCFYFRSLRDNNINFIEPGTFASLGKLESL